MLDYFNDKGDIADFAEVLADDLTPSNQQTNKLTFTLNLDAFETDSFFADVSITGYAASAPVPLPGALWLMATSLAFLLRQKRPVKATNPND